MNSEEPFLHWFTQRQRWSLGTRRSLEVLSGLLK